MCLTGVSTTVNILSYIFASAAVPLGARRFARVKKMLIAGGEMLFRGRVGECFPNFMPPSHDGCVFFLA